MTGMETKRASGKCIANALVCQLRSSDAIYDSFPNLQSSMHATRHYQYFRYIFTAACYIERDIAMTSCLSVRLSVGLSVCDVVVPCWSHRLKFLKKLFYG